MLFYLYEYRDLFTPLNVFRYVSFRMVMSVITSLAMSWLMYPSFIRRLQNAQIGQVVRDDGPQTHLKKRGTPTMGGSLILLTVTVSTLLWTDLSNHFVWMVLTITATFGLIGFYDDYKKIKEKGSRGLPGRWKLILQFSIAALVVGVLFNDGSLDFSTQLYLPFVAADRFSLELPVLLYAVFAMFVIVGTSNAVNLTDGLDGLAIGPVIVAAATFLVLCYGAGTILVVPAEVDGQQVYAAFDVAEYLRIPHVAGLAELAVFAAAIIGAGIGFLWFNSYPASVFMGDVGSLSLGGALGTLAVLSKNELLSLVIFGIFLLEAISVITQTTSFKLTGKRVFKMAPIHHHFELKGWAEPKVIVRFWIVSLLLALVALASLKLR
ncbi:MAG: phospho-N-acetylmuramoyl-pentapeptide-transferase [Myxococcota bacterium]|jgi:phospho-N-acetylmuramoyl-pentapeptide-transferase|nr:phospho-N-acetylmuramoyl-pentapeptide-transferase [Myxococcota bacterium]